MQRYGPTLLERLPSWLFADPAVKQPDETETKHARSEVTGRSVKKIYASFNNAETQKIRVSLADE
jgi:hypothetical protein